MSKRLSIKKWNFKTETNLEGFIHEFDFRGSLQLVSAVGGDHKLDPVAMLKSEIPHLKKIENFFIYKSKLLVVPKPIYNF
jgi:hypothetical protein